VVTGADPDRLAEGFIPTPVNGARRAQDALRTAEDLGAGRGPEDALLDAEARFRTAFDDAPIGMALISLERRSMGCFMRVNRALRDITGYTEGQLIGTDLQAITHPDDHKPDLRYLPWMVAGETTHYEVEKLLVHADGSPPWALLSTSLVKSADGRPLYLIAQLQDITERKKAELALLDSREQLRAIIDNATAVVYLKDKDGRFLLVNRQFEVLVGLDKDEIIGGTDAELFPPETADAVRAGDEEVLLTGIPLQVEEVTGRPDAPPRTYLSIKFPLLDGDGVPQGVGSISTDITERKQAEDALKASEERFRQIVRTAHDAFVSMDAEGRITDWNPAAEQTFGWRATEIIGRTLSSTIVPPRYREAHGRGLQQFLETGRGPLLNKRVEIEALHRDGHEFPVEITISALRVGERYVFNAFLHDISERKRAEQLFNAQHEVTLVLSQSATTEDAFPRVLESLAGKLGWRFAAFWTGEDDGSVLSCHSIWHQPSQSVSRLAEHTGEATFAPGAGPVGRVWMSGELAWSSDVATEPGFLRVEAATEASLGGAIYVPIKSANRVLAVIELLTDDARPPEEDLLEMLATIASQIGQFVERKRAEEALREMEEGFRSAFQDAPIGIALVSVVPGSAGRLLQVNSALSEITGYAEEALYSLELSELTHPDDRGAEQPLIENLLAGEIPNYQLEERYVRPDGDVVWVMVSASTVHNAAGRLLYAVAQIQDITERKKAEQDLAAAAAELERRATELERSNADLQQFAYVASHDLSEPLRMVSSYVQLLAKRYQGKLDSDADDFIGFAVDGATRMQALIDGLLMYSRVGTSDYAFGPVDCAEVVQQTLVMLEKRMEETGAVVTVDPLPTVHGDPTQLGQLFQNLIGNAMKFTDAEPRIHVSAEEEEHGWRFTVSDNGIGIDPRHVDRIFQVFQRLHTRDAYPGSGVGLAICKRIVERHGGSIRVDPNPGGGTKFSFTIPKREGTQEDHRPASEPPTS
jgi:PAS domain S-box-containing protein